MISSSVTELRLEGQLRPKDKSISNDLIQLCQLTCPGNKMGITSQNNLGEKMDIKARARVLGDYFFESAIADK